MYTFAHSKSPMRGRFFVVALIIMLGMALGLTPTVRGQQGEPNIPDGYSGYLVFMANGEVSLDEPAAFITDAFFTDVMGWSQTELNTFREEGLKRVEERFGIPDPANNPDVVVLTMESNPARNYRAYTVGGRQVPSQGFEVREGVVFTVVTKPEGIMLGGEFQGVHLPATASVVFGIYNIEVTTDDGEPTGEEMIIHFRSAQPLPPAPPDAALVAQISIFCEIFSDEFGAGLAQGIANPKIIGEGDDQFLKSNTRNVLTFSALGGR